MPRTPEQGHTKACLAAAMIRAIEDARDDVWEDDMSFRIVAQDNRFLHRADAELNPENHRGGATCTCPPLPVCDGLPLDQTTCPDRAAHM